MQNSHYKILKIFACVGVVFILFFGYFGLSLLTFSNSNGETQPTENPSSLSSNISRNFNNNPSQKHENFNILILGEGGKEHISGYLTDTLIVANFQTSPTEDTKITLVSIPRDLFVQINPEDENSYYTKINAVKSANKDLGIEKTIKQITGLPIKNYLEIDFTAFKNIIDTLGCVSIFVEKDIYDPLFPGPNYTYEPFTITSGWHCMNGETALKYVRSRHSAFGDLDRIKRQQQIIEAIKINLFSPRTLFNFKKLSSLYDTLTENISTNIELSEMKKFYEILNDAKPENIKNISIDTQEARLLTNQNSTSTGSILIPTEGLGKYDMIKEYIANKIFH